MPKRIYFITSEVSPFSEVSPLAEFSNRIPAHFQDRKQDFRIFTPRYGFISERRYVIREVIRLKEIEVDFKGDVILGSAKSAFVPGTKVQVYFMDYAPYFGGKNKSLYTVSEGRYNSRNGEKYGFFSKIAIENLTYLYWQPDYIVCNDWTTAMVPVLMKKYYADEEFFANSRTVLNIVNPMELGKFEAKHLKMAGLEPDDIKGYENNLLGLAAECADEVMTVSVGDADNTKALKAHKGFTAAMKKTGKTLHHFKVKEDTDEAWRTLGTELETFFEVEN